MDYLSQVVEYLSTNRSIAYSAFVTGHLWSVSLELHTTNPLVWILFNGLNAFMAARAAVAFSGLLPKNAKCVFTLALLSLSGHYLNQLLNKDKDD